MSDRGMTHAQIADEVSRRTGYKVARSTVSAALLRSGNARRAKKHVEEIPWTVKTEHRTHYAARMLALLGRRRSGAGNTPENDQRLDTWLSQLKSSGAVVVYVPDTPEGFYYIEGPWDRPDVPIMQNFPPN